MSEEEKSELEIEFEKHVAKVQAEIRAKTDKAMELLRAACKLATEKGVSFRSPISPLSQCYIVPPPAEFDALDSDIVGDITDTWGDEEGWQHSAVCY